MIKTFQIFTQHLRGSSRLEFWILVIRIYKKPELIPDEYFNRLGFKKPRFD